MSADRPRGKRGPAPGYGAKGGVRVTVRLTDHAHAAVSAEASNRYSKSDVIAAIVERWARDRANIIWREATFAEARAGDTIRIAGTSVVTVVDVATAKGITSILSADVTGRQMEATHRSDTPIEIDTGGRLLHVTGDAELSRDGSDALAVVAQAAVAHLADRRGRDMGGEGRGEGPEPPTE
jgi:hypothetical protein